MRPTANDRRRSRQLISALFICSSSMAAAPAVSAEETVWNVSLWGTPRAWTTGVEAISKYVEEKSDGQFRMVLNYGESISPAKENLDGIAIQAFEAAYVCVGYHPGKTPLMTVLELPFLPIPDMQAHARIAEALYEHPAVREEMAKWNAMAFFLPLLPMYEFMGKGEAPRTLDDWKGRRVRALGGMGEAMRHVGAVPTSVRAPEMYTSMERGLFEAAAFPLDAFMDFNLYEVADWYTINLQLGASHCPMIVNLPAWDALSESNQDILQEAKQPAYDHMEGVYEEAIEKALELFDKRLMRVEVSSDQRDEFVTRAAQPVWEKWAEDHEAEGRPAREILDFVLAEARKSAEPPK